MENENLPVVVSNKASSILELPHDQMIEQATKMAVTLNSVIEKQNLYSVIGDKKHVKAEGWATLGTMLGVLPREVEVKEHQNGTFEAKIELINVRTGMIVGQASAICGRDEKRWANADRFARRSMAITRATGKAYRLGFAWIVSLAGYSGTPAEEVNEPAKPKGQIYTGTKEQQEKVTEYCKRNNIPEDKWADIDARLNGRMSTELPAIVKELMKDGQVNAAQ